MLKLHRHFQQIIFATQFFQHFVAGFTHHGGTRVVVLVHAVTEAHQAERVVLIFRTTHELRDVLNGADLFEHLQCCFVGATVCWPPQRSNTGRDTRERVSTRRTGGTYGRGGCVLLVVSMQDQNTIHRAFQDRVHFVIFAWGREHHTQEVTGVGEVVAWIHKRLTDGIFVAHRGHGRHFRQQAECGNFAMTRVIHIQRVVIERRQRTGNPAHHRHRVRVATERME